MKRFYVYGTDDPPKKEWRFKLENNHNFNLCLSLVDKNNGKEIATLLYIDHVGRLKLVKITDDLDNFGYETQGLWLDKEGKIQLSD